MTVLWLASVLAPLGAALAMGLAGLLPDRSAATARSRLIGLAPLATLPAAALAVAGPAAGQVQLPWLLLGSRLAVDPLARPLLLTTALLYAAALAAVRASTGERRTELSGFLLVCFLGNAVVFVAADAVTFYLAFTVMSLCGYVLVVHDRTPKARRAGGVYLVLTLLSEMFLLAGLLVVVQAGGVLLEAAPAAVAASPHTEGVVALLLVGFGVKAGTVPLHVWLPLAHPAAPAAASAVLSGTMIAAGLFGWLRFLPLGQVALPGWGGLLVALALAGALLAVVAGVLQSDPKVVLAYSSISQMGLLAALVGAALADPALAAGAVAAAVLYAVHHGFAKGALFLAVPVWKSFGNGPGRWWVLTGAVLAGLTLAGAPGTAGAVGKYAAKAAVEGAPAGPVDLATLLPLVATGSTVLVVRYLYVLLPVPLEARRPGAAAPDGAAAAWCALVLAGAGLGWWVAVGWSLDVDVPALSASTLWDQVWPIGAGLALAAVALALSRRGRLPVWAAHPDGRTVPPGDLVVPEERLAHRAAGTSSRAARRALAGAAHARRSAARARRVPPPTALAGFLEGRVARWQASGLLLLVVLSAFVMALTP